MKTLEGERSREEVIEMMGEAVRTQPGGQELVLRAWDFAREAHDDQRRRSGEPHTEHLFQTAKNLADLSMDSTVVATGLLHDTIEDTEITKEDIETAFGTEIAFLVEGVTKIKSRRNDPDYDKSENLRRFMLAASKDVRVVIVKLCDRLHNMRTITFMPPVKRKRIALETLEVYVPIADRLAMNDIKRELEDLAFPHAYPKECALIKPLFDAQIQAQQKRLEEAKEVVTAHFQEARDVEIDVYLRSKGLYSFYAKYERKNNDINAIRDIITLQIVIPDSVGCYAALGTIHALWRPVPAKVKDYIAFPKPNGYRCLRTQVDADTLGIIEIQIYDPFMYAYSKSGLAYAMRQAGGETQSNSPSSLFTRFVQKLRAAFS